MTQSVPIRQDSAHADGLVGLWLLLTLLAWRRERMFFTGVLVGLAVATKVAALVVVPLFLFGPRRTVAFWRSARAVEIGFVAALGAAYLPFLAGSRSSDVAGLQTFASQWRFNPLLYRVIEAGVPSGMARPVAALAIGAGVIALLWRWRVASKADDEAVMPPVDTAFCCFCCWRRSSTPGTRCGHSARRSPSAALSCPGWAASLCSPTSTAACCEKPGGGPSRSRSTPTTCPGRSR